MIKFNCTYCQITIDGTKAKHDRSRVYKSGKESFDVLISNIELLSEFSRINPKFKTIMRINIENESIKDVKQTLECIKQKSRKYIHVLIRRVFSTCYYKSKKNMYTQLYDYNSLARELGFLVFKNQNLLSSCEACNDLNTLHILPDLSVYKCVNDLRFDNSKIGYVTEDGILKLDQMKVANWFNASNFIYDKNCINCSKAASCLGGCILYKLKTGNRGCADIEQLVGGYL